LQQHATDSQNRRHAEGQADGGCPALAVQRTFTPRQCAPIIGDRPPYPSGYLAGGIDSAMGGQPAPAAGPIPTGAPSGAHGECSANRSGNWA
jgi:hypothetical protein